VIIHIPELNIESNLSIHFKTLDLRDIYYSYAALTCIYLHISYMSLIDPLLQVKMKCNLSLTDTMRNNGVI